MALGSTLPPKEMSARNLPGSKGRPARKADNLTTIWGPRRFTTLWASMACYRDSSTVFFYLSKPSSCRCTVCVVQESLTITVSSHLSIVSYRKETLILNAKTLKWKCGISTFNTFTSHLVQYCSTLASHLPYICLLLFNNEYSRIKPPKAATFSIFNSQRTSRGYKRGGLASR
jgi:hypothetical protein